MLLSDFHIDFYLSGRELNPLGGPAYFDGQGNLIPLYVSSGNFNLPVAAVNGDCRAVQTEQTTFGRLKNLYR